MKTMAVRIIIIIIISKLIRYLLYWYISSLARDVILLSK